MLLTRVILFSGLILLCCASALAQRPGPEFWRKVSCEPLEPRTVLEKFENQYNAVIIKAFTRITTIEVRGVRIDAVEMRAMGSTPRAKGLVISLREEGPRPN